MWIDLLIQLILTLIGKLEASPDCPGGICEPLKAEVEKLERAKMAVRPAGLLDFFKCVDLEKLVECATCLVKVIVEGLQGCKPQDPDITV